MQRQPNLFSAFVSPELRETALIGGLAHMVERLLCKQEAKGSIPLISIFLLLLLESVNGGYGNSGTFAAQFVRFYHGTSIALGVKVIWCLLGVVLVRGGFPARIFVCRLARS